MPELPEVETVCRGLRPHLEGRRIRRVRVRRGDLRFALPHGFAAGLEGRRIAAVRRRAKFILVHLENGSVLLAHLGMSGRLLLLPDPPPEAGPHDHLDLVTEDGTTIRYRDPRRFGFMELVPEPELAGHRMLRRLGPEPLSPAFTSERLGAALAGRQTSIKAALLDQRIVAGLGNIYVCEALYRAGISPKRRAGTVPGRRAARLVGAIRTVLEEAIAAGGSSLRDYVQTDGSLGYFQHRWRVYGRAGDECGFADCTGTIRRIVQGGRSTFYCAGHQR